MNRAHFLQLLERRGSDLDKWPESERSAASLLVASDKGAAADLAEAQRFDRHIERGLSSRAFPDTSGEAASRILSRLAAPLPAQMTSESRAFDRMWKLLRMLRFQALSKLAPGAPWPQAATLAVAAVLGVVCGIYGAQQQVFQDRQALLVLQQESDTDLTGVLSGNRGSMGTYQ